MPGYGIASSGRSSCPGGRDDKPQQKLCCINLLSALSEEKDTGAASSLHGDARTLKKDETD